LARSRLLVVVPVVVVPLGQTQMHNDMATPQFPALYATFWLLLRGPAGRVGALFAANPAKRWRFESAGPAVAWATLLAVVCVAGVRVRNLRAAGPTWHDVLATATRHCGVDPARRSYPFRAQWWGINIPCRLVR
jgi:hypothetical protein